MFYEKFILLCNSKRMTPCSVANMLQISKSCVTRWKNGGDPTDANCKKIADFFAVSMDELKNDYNSNDKSTIFYSRFLELCNRANITPANVANELNLSLPAITRWKNGSMPRVCTLNKISNFFGVTLEYFENVDEEIQKEMRLNSKPNKHHTNIRKSSSILDLINIAQELPENKLEVLLNVAYAMKE